MTSQPIQIGNAYLKSKDAKTLAAEVKAFLPSNPTSAAVALKAVIAGLEDITNPQLIALGEELLSNNILGASGLEAETYLITKELFDIYVARSDYKNATAFLGRASLVKEDPNISIEDRFQSILNLITAYLELKQSISCEPLLAVAHQLASKTKKNKELQIQYNYCCGQYFNFNRQFLHSAMRYYAASSIEPDSSQQSSEMVADILSKTIDATILAPTGSKKAFLVANLTKDERAKSFPNYKLLQKFAREVLIGKEEVEQFSKGLKTHQNIREKDGFTNVQRVFLEHNILVISKFYRDIKIASLAEKLLVQPSELESLLQNMNKEGKISIEIDHATDMIILQDDSKRAKVAQRGLAAFLELLDKVQG